MGNGAVAGGGRVLRDERLCGSSVNPLPHSLVKHACIRLPPRWPPPPRPPTLSCAPRTPPPPADEAPGIVYADLDFGQLAERRQNMPLRQQKRGDLYALLDLTRPPSTAAAAANGDAS